jgi:hypothetical protein
MGIFVVWIVCVVACAILAGNKGRSVGGWFILGLLLGPIALVLAAVVSNKTSDRQAADTAVARSAEEANLRTCPFAAASWSAMRTRSGSEAAFRRKLEPFAVDIRASRSDDNAAGQKYRHRMAAADQSATW